MRRPFKYSSASICPLGCFISKGSNANNDNTHNNIDRVDLPCDWRAGRHRPDYWQRERRLYVVVVTVQEKCKKLYNVQRLFALLFCFLSITILSTTIGRKPIVRRPDER